MKKKILGLALISLITFSGMAQNSTDNIVSKQENTNLKKTERHHAARPTPFEGLNLTDAQKSKLKELDAKCMDEHKKQAQIRKEEARKQAQARKADRRHNDSIRLAEHKAAKKKYLDEVKAIVGPEKYVTYLENIYINGNRKSNSEKAAISKLKKTKNNDFHKRDRKKDQPNKQLKKQSATKKETTNS